MKEDQTDRKTASERNPAGYIENGEQKPEQEMFRW